MVNGIGLLRQFCDTVWEYDIESGKVYFHHDSVTPDMVGDWHAYDTVYETYRNLYVYREDREIWERYMSPDHLRGFLQSKREDRKFFIRLDHTRNGFEWHEGHISRISEQRVLIGSLDIHIAQRNATIVQAVLPEFDYVCRIDVKTKSYVLYNSKNQDTIVPQHTGDDYYQVMAEFNKQYVVEEWKELNQKMRLENIMHQLEHADEYCFYAKSRDADRMTYKKFRFCYADNSRKELLMTRTDVSDVMGERLLREQEEKKRLAYLENMPVAFCSIEILSGSDGKPEDFMFTYVNQAYEKFENVEKETVIGKPYYKTFPNTNPKLLQYFYETAYMVKTQVLREHSVKLDKELLIHMFQTEVGHCECVIQDLTKEFLLTQELHRNQAEMKRILDSTTDLVFQYLPSRKEVFLDTAGMAESHRSYPLEGLFAKMAENGHLEQSGVARLEDCFARVCKGEHYMSVKVRGRKNPGENWIWYRLTLFDYQDEYTLERKVIGYIQNIHTEVTTQAKLQRAAQTDALTGILNVGAGKQKAEHILECQENLPFSYNAMFLIDVDDFKGVNDNWGHMIGDEVLMQLAHMLKETFRVEDVVYRLGGDEFAVFAADIKDPKDSIDSMMKRLFRQLEEAKKKYPFFGISVGVYVSGEQHSYEHYYAEADRALYQTKERGKGRYTLRLEE